MNEEEYQAQPIKDEQVIPLEELDDTYYFKPIKEFITPNMSLKNGAKIVGRIPGRPSLDVVKFPDGRTFTKEIT